MQHSMPQTTSHVEPSGATDSEPRSGTRTLSKSDFKIASSCQMKLFWREEGWADNSDRNAYLQLLADGGFMVEALARELYPGGTLVDTGHATQDAHLARKLLAQENVTLYQATFLYGRRLVRCDIVQ